MAKSIRISDEMYDRAQTSAALLHRSLNQQIEYWIALGQLLDQSLSRDELMAALIKNGHARDEQAVQSGALRQEDLYFAPPETIRNMTVHFSPRSLGEFEL